MTGVSIRAEIRDAEVRAGLKRLGQWRERAAKPIGMALVKGTHRRFRQGRDPDGKAWAPLKPAYAAIKRGPGILRASGMLMRSITFEASPTQVRVGTNRVYAAIHQFGGTIRPKSASRLVFRLAGGLVRARSVTIPARPFLGVDGEDRQEILDVIEGLLDRLGRQAP